MSGIFWTPEMIAKLRRLWNEEGLSASQCADRIPGVSRNACIGKARRLGLERRENPIKSDRPATQRAKVVPISYRAQLSPHVIPLPSRPTAKRRPTLVEVPLQDSPGFTLEQVQEMKACRWPLGDIKSKPTHFCGQEQALGSAYCASHRQLGSQRATGSLFKAEWMTVKQR